MTELPIPAYLAEQVDIAAAEQLILEAIERGWTIDTISSYERSGRYEGRHLRKACMNLGVGCHADTRLLYRYGEVPA